METGPLQEITGQMKEAMKAGDARAVGALRFILSALQRAEKDFQGKNGLTAALPAAEQIAVLQKEAKKRKEAIELYEKGGRSELADKERYELEILLRYVPKPLSEKELDAFIDAALAAGARDFSAVMREVMKRAEGRAEGKIVSERIRARLGGQ